MFLIALKRIKIAVLTSLLEFWYTVIWKIHYSTVWNERQWVTILPSTTLYPWRLFCHQSLLIGQKWSRLTANSFCNGRSNLKPYSDPNPNPNPCVIINKKSLILAQSWTLRLSTLTQYPTLNCWSVISRFNSIPFYLSTNAADSMVDLLKLFAFSKWSFQTIDRFI